MKDLNMVRVEIILAKGQMSPVRLGELRAGDVVPFLDRSPGEPATLVGNGRTLAYVEPYAKEDRWFFQIFDGDWKPKRLPNRLSSETLLDRLTMELRIWSGSVDVHSVGRLGAGSVLAAAKGKTGAATAELTVFGETVATGTPVISGEFWGLRVDEVLAAGWKQGAAGTANALPGELKIYDFTRPDRFSMEQIHSMAGLHASISDRLMSFSPQLKPISVELVDQIAWYEIEELVDVGDPCIELSAGHRAVADAESGAHESIEYFLDLDTGNSNAELEREYRKRARDMACAVPLEKVLVCWSGGRGDLDTELLASIMEETWSRVFPVQFKSRSEWRQVDREVFLEEFEMTIVVRLKTQRGKLSFIYPYRNLRKLLGLLAGSSK